MKFLRLINAMLLVFILLGISRVQAAPAPQEVVLPTTWAHSSAVLWDNGPLVTHPGVCGGQNASRLQTDLNMNTLRSGGESWERGKGWRRSRRGQG